MVKAGAAQVLARGPDQHAGGAVEVHIGAGAGGHAHGLPVAVVPADAGLVHGDGDQAALAVRQPAADQGAVHGAGAGAPGLVAGQANRRACLQRRALRGVGRCRRGLHALARRLGAPDGPAQSFGGQVGLQFGQDGQGIGMTFIELGQAQAVGSHFGQCSPALQRVAMARQRQAVGALRYQQGQLVRRRQVRMAAQGLGQRVAACPRIGVLVVVLGHHRSPSFFVPCAAWEMGEAPGDAMVPGG